MYINEKCAYIKGLFEGLNLDPAKPEAKLIKELIDLVSDIIEEIDAVEEDVEELEEYVEELDHDLGDVETVVFECEDDDCDCDCCSGDELDCEDCDGCDPECDCEDCGGCPMEDYCEVECPNCGETICFDTDIEPTEMVCPACNKSFNE